MFITLASKRWSYRWPEPLNVRNHLRPTFTFYYIRSTHNTHPLTWLSSLPSQTSRTYKHYHQLPPATTLVLPPPPTTDEPPPSDPKASVGSRSTISVSNLQFSPSNLRFSSPYLWAPVSGDNHHLHPSMSSRLTFPCRYPTTNENIDLTRSYENTSKYTVDRHLVSDIESRSCFSFIFHL